VSSTLQPALLCPSPLLSTCSLLFPLLCPSPLLSTCSLLVPLLCSFLCLRCCGATSLSLSTLQSCSNIYSTMRGAPSNDKFCPTPPSLSIYSGTSGPLDTINTYVAEHLLRISTSAPDIDVVTFFRRYQAGFTVTAPDPVVSVCDLSRENGFSDFGRNVFNAFRTISCNESDPESAPDQMCPAYASQETSNCSMSFNLTSRNPSCYSVDPVISATLKASTC